METTKPMPMPRDGLYTIPEAAALLNVKPDTLRWYLRRQHRVTPRRATAGARGAILLTTADVMAMWEFVRMERGY
jgi:hypothetical protein